MAKNSGYELSRRWFDFAFDNKDAKAIHTAIYMWAIELNNRLGWKDEFGFPTNDTMEGLSIGNRNTYFDAIRDLVSWGFIKIVRESKNRHTATVISICSFNAGVKKNSALQNVVVQNLTATDTATDTGSDTPTDTPTAPIDKPINHKPINIEFDTFWELYGKKVGNKSNCIKKWNKLKDDEREKIIKTLPLFISITSKGNKQFQPYPQTYLNDRRWEDEINNDQPKASEVKYKCQRDFNNYGEYLIYCKEKSIQPDKREPAPWESMNV